MSTSQVITIIDRIKICEKLFGVLGISEEEIDLEKEIPIITEGVIRESLRSESLINIDDEAIEESYIKTEELEGEMQKLMVMMQGGKSKSQPSWTDSKKVSLEDIAKKKRGEEEEKEPEPPQPFEYKL